MFKYNKKLQYPINIDKKDLKMAKYLVTQYGGANGELGAALRYLNQRFTMPDDRGKALLTDIGTEELGHVEMLETMIYQLMKDATLEELKEIKESVPIPIVAIGGVNEDNIALLRETGVDGAAVISAIVGQKDITAAAEELISNFRGA